MFLKLNNPYSPSGPLKSCLFWQMKQPGIPDYCHLFYIGMILRSQIQHSKFFNSLKKIAEALFGLPVTSIRYAPGYSWGLI